MSIGRRAACFQLVAAELSVVDWRLSAFSTLSAANTHEARCRLKVGEKPAFECRKCGMRLHVGTWFMKILFGVGGRKLDLQKLR